MRRVRCEQGKMNSSLRVSNIYSNYYPQETNKRRTALEIKSNHITTLAFNTALQGITENNCFFEGLSVKLVT